MPASPTATPEHIKDVNTRYHDAAAEEYDAKWGIDFGATGQEQVRQKLAKALGGRDESFGAGLEIGSGTGYFSLNLLQLGAIQSLTATDISAGMLKRLSNTAKALGLEAETVRTEAEELPFEDESFDLVFGHAVLHHIPDLDKAFAEFRRVLRPGGAIAFCGEPSRYGDRLAELPKRAGLFVAPAWRRAIQAEPRAIAEAAQSEGHSLEGEEFPSLRAGIARGPALAQSGDYYGRSVNLASRITGVAKPGSVLVDQEAKRAAPDAFDYSYAGERRLKGFESRTKLYRVRREGGG